jgi:hypothetical protein
MKKVVWGTVRVDQVLTVIDVSYPQTRPVLNDSSLLRLKNFVDFDRSIYAVCNRQFLGMLSKLPVTKYKKLYNIFTDELPMLAPRGALQTFYGRNRVHTERNLMRTSMGANLRCKVGDALVERRRREDRGAKGAEGVGSGEGVYPLPSRLGGLRERRELPSRVRGSAPAANDFGTF